MFTRKQWKRSHSSNVESLSGLSLASHHRICAEWLLGLRWNIHFISYERGKLPLQSDKEESSLLKWDLRAGRSLRAPKFDYPQLVCLKSESRKAGDVVVYSRDPDPSLLLREQEATKSTRKAREWAKSGSGNKQFNQFTSAQLDKL